jgi:uncharacterized protein YueI
VTFIDQIFQSLNLSVNTNENMLAVYTERITVRIEGIKNKSTSKMTYKFLQTKLLTEVNRQYNLSVTIPMKKFRRYIPMTLRTILSGILKGKSYGDVIFILMELPSE